MKKASIIVPIYNVENYIKKCVLSLMNQDYSNLEIILVDDGSPDDSAKIIDELKENDDRIIVIHQKNSGVSVARNKGLSIATGEYILFVDGDDWVDIDYVSHFVGVLEKSGCDIAMNKYCHTMSQSSLSNSLPSVSSEKAIEWIYMGKMDVAVWNKAYKREFLIDNQINFHNDIWYGEGMLFNIECLQYTDKVALGEKKVYHQTFNPNSAMRKFNLESQFCGIRSLDIQKSLWKKRNNGIENAWKYHRYCFNTSIIDGLVRADMLKDNREIYQKCVADLRKKILIPLKMNITLKRKIMFLCYFVSPYFMALRRSCKFRKLEYLSGGG